jgi:tRNA threonylcarbamoyladenosine modification (KEOPS) complex  Pcc1 subunit
MIQNDAELEQMRERIDFFMKTIAQIRVKASSPSEYRAFANSYLAEVEKMNLEILEYLKRHPSEIEPARAA